MASAKGNEAGTVSGLGRDTQREAPIKFAVCVNNAGYPASLELHKIYRILLDEDAKLDGDIRIVDESGKGYLYPAERFIMVDLPQTVEKSLLQGG